MIALCLFTFSGQFVPLFTRDAPLRTPTTKRAEHREWYNDPPTMVASAAGSSVPFYNTSASEPRNPRTQPKTKGEAGKDSSPLACGRSATVLREEDAFLTMITNPAGGAAAAMQRRRSAFSEADGPLLEAPSSSRVQIQEDELRGVLRGA